MSVRSGTTTVKTAVLTFECHTNRLARDRGLIDTMFLVGQQRLDLDRNWAVIKVTYDEVVIRWPDLRDELASDDEGEPNAEKSVYDSRLTWMEKAEGYYRTATHVLNTIEDELVRCVEEQIRNCES